MEEGLATDTPHETINARFSAAEDKAMIDMRDGMENITDHIRWFRPGAPIQPTWKYPIALYLYFKKGVIPAKESIREYQTTKLGDSSLKETAAVELMPLPSNNVSEDTWLYSDLNIPNLKTRKEYIETYKPERVKKLHELVKDHKPKLVIFYSLTYLSDWKEVIGYDMPEVTDGMYFTEHEGTSYCVIPQSVSFGMSYDRLYEFADKIKSQVDIQ